MKYKEFTDKKNAIEFAKENGGYYEIVVDDRANNIYIVFYRWPGRNFEQRRLTTAYLIKIGIFGSLVNFLIWYIIYVFKKKGR